MLIKGEGKQALAEFTIDTGYSGTFTLPLADCLALGLLYTGSKRTTLADGSQIRLGIYQIAVIWNDKEQDFEILAVGEERLLGTQFLEGYKLCLDFGKNTLTIEKSP